MSTRFIAILLGLLIVAAMVVAVIAAQIDSGLLGIGAVLAGGTAGARLLDLIDDQIRED